MTEEEKKQGQVNPEGFYTQEEMDIINGTSSNASSKEEAKTEVKGDDTIAGIDLSLLDPDVADVLKESYSPQVDYIDTLLKAKEEEVKRQEEEDKKRSENDYNAQVWGGLTQALGSLVNLGGVTAGGVNAEWKSPLPTWATRADSLRRERASNLKSARSELNTLVAQRTQLTKALGSSVSSYARAKTQQDASVEKAKISAQAAVNKAVISQETALAKLDATTKTNLIKEANDLVQRQMASYATVNGATMPYAEIERMTKIIVNGLIAEYNSMPSTIATESKPKSVANFEF